VKPDRSDDGRPAASDAPGAAFRAPVALAAALLAGALAGPAAGDAASLAAQAPEAAAAAADRPRPEARQPFRRPPPEVLESRRRALLESLGSGVALVRSASTKDIESAYPQASDFRQNNDFLYLTGLETPDSWLLLASRPEGGTARILFVPEPDPDRARWTGERPGAEEASRISGVRDVRHTAEFEEMARSGQLAALAGDDPLHLPLNGDALDDPLVEELAAGSSAPVRDVEPLLAQLRLVKGDFEVEMLREAVSVTDRAIGAALRAARPGMWEYEIEAAVEDVFHRSGAERVGFPSIVGSGPNSVVLHYDDSRRKTEEGDLVVMDVGAEYSYYTADVTRTFPVSGEFTDRQRAIYDLVLGAQRAALAAVEPGATMADVERAARSYMRERSGDLCGDTTCDEHFGHGVGHWLGMDVHDVGSYSTPFRPGMVLTVEPGVYLPEEDLGVRIEDDVLVTEDGREVLSSAPRTVEEVEAAKAEEAERQED
jgi:Xaa-Pro aminopeptidase